MQGLSVRNPVGLSTRKLIAHATNPADHAELAHMGLHSLNVVVLEELLDFIHRPAGGEPRVFMEKQPSMLPLMVISLRTESNIPLGLLHAELEFLHPSLVVAVHILVELL